MKVVFQWNQRCHLPSYNEFGDISNHCGVSVAGPGVTSAQRRRAELCVFDVLDLEVLGLPIVVSQDRYSGPNYTG